MNQFFKRVGTLLLCLMMLWGVAVAESCFTIDVDTLDLDQLNSDEYVAVSLTSSAQGVRIRKLISDNSELAAAVRLSITQMDSQTLLLDKDYGYQSGVFDSGVIYLSCAGAGTTPYLVTLYVGDHVYALPFMHQHQQPKSTEWTEEAWSDDWSDGWSDGWDDGWSDGWSDGW